MKLRKKLLLLAILLVVFIIWGSWYLEKVFLPEKIKTLTASFIKDKLELESTLKSVNFSFWRGIEVTELEINNPAEFEQKKLLQVKKAVLKPALIPLLRKRLVISAVVIDKPQLTLERTQDGNWNIVSLLSALSKKSEPGEGKIKKQFSLQVTKIIVQEANVSFVDNSLAPPFKKQIRDLNLNISPFAVPLALAYSLDCIIEPDETKIEVKGKIFPLAKRGGIYLNISHLKLADVSPYLTKLTAFYFKDGYADLNAELSLNKNELSGEGTFNLSQIAFYLKDVYEDPLIFSSGKITSQIHIDIEKDNISLQKTSISVGEIHINGEGEIKDFKDTPELIFKFSTPLLELKKLNFAFPTAISDFYKSLNTAGSFKINQGELSVPFKKMAETKYKLSAELQKAELKLAFLSSKINNIDGFLNFERDRLEISNLKAQIDKLPFSVNGNWQLNKPQKIDLDLIFSKFSLEELRNALKKNIPGIAPPLNFEGTGSGQLKITGEFKKLNWQGHLQFIEGKIAGYNWTDKIEKVNGELYFTDSSLSVKSLKGSWKNIPLTLSGELGNFKQPQVKVSLTGGETNLKGEAKFLKNSGKLINLSGEYKGIPIKAQGDFKTLNPLTVDCSLESSSLELEKLARILPAKFSEIKKNLKLSGKADFRANIEGELSNWKKWKVNGNLYFPSLHIIKFNIKELSSNFNLDNQNLNLPDIKALLSGGAINGNFKINLAEAYPSYDGNLLLTNVDLARFGKETDWKDLKFQGLASSEIKFNGFGSDWKRLKGNGWIHLIGSHLWEIPLLGELANILLIPGLDKTIIQEGHCNFNINQGRIYTKDLELLSDNVSLQAEGSAGIIDTTLDFDILMQFSGAMRKKVDTLTKLANLVLKTVEHLLVEIELKGTVADPKYSIRPFPVDKILRREIKKKLGDFLEELLEEKKE